MAEKSILAQIFASLRAGSDRPQAGRHFTISWTMLAAICVTLVCAVAWSFYMGYMVGQGHNPQESFHEMTGMLKPEEPVARQQESAPELEPVPAALLKPQEAAAKAWPDAKPVAKPQAKPAQQVKKVVDNRAYDYVFQLAAIKSEADAQKTQKQLAAKGVACSVRKSGKVYLLVANLRGNQKAVETLEAKLRSVKLGKPLQLSRKPVETGQPKKR